ncbi:hypothetical protein CEXT_664741 [Caerostris extrusa]|uniref:Uncharacterized protein n=1 Tax=Caerostris extrusa TaxID=172846 RepID=A0AAV4TZ15_CAEEX|nr:hypothetical protein CEXT_664741 [Caerostris extrusa]
MRETSLFIPKLSPLCRYFQVIGLEFATKSCGESWICASGGTSVPQSVLEGCRFENSSGDLYSFQKRVGRLNSDVISSIKKCRH